MNETIGRLLAVGNVAEVFELGSRVVSSTNPQLVAAFGRRCHGKAAAGAYQMKRLALARLPRILAKPNADVLRGGIEQQPLDVAGRVPRFGGLIGAGHQLLLVAPSSRSTSRWRHEERASRASNARIS